MGSRSVVEHFPDILEALGSISILKKVDYKGRIKVPSPSCTYMESNEQQHGDCLAAY